MHDIFRKNISEGRPKLIIRVCPIYMSRRVVHKINYQSMSNIIRVCPIYMSQRVAHKINYRSMSTIYVSKGFPQIKQIYLFGNNFHTWHKHV